MIFYFEKMYLQKVKLAKKIIMVAVLKVTDENSRIRMRSKNVTDLYQNVTDPQHWFFRIEKNVCRCFRHTFPYSYHTFLVVQTVGPRHLQTLGRRAGLY
jgi:hypothetical protein